MTAMEWATIASLATAAGTLVLAVATFASVRSGNRSARAADRAARTAERSARIAERSLLAGQRPLLVNSRPQDPVQQVQFHEGKSLTVPGGGAELEVTDAAVYMAISVRNVGTGLAVMRGWHVGIGLREERSHPPLEEFTAQIRDIYVAPGDNGFWLGALRDPAAAEFAALSAAIGEGNPLMISLLYGDFEGGQRIISQFALRRADGADGRWLTAAGRHFNVDRPDPR